tara:strand:+ start:21 stop:140 length:120 start_codon:yes stop_codon:yes gene_type:complete
MEMAGENNDSIPRNTVMLFGGVFADVAPAQVGPWSTTRF